MTRRRRPPPSLEEAFLNVARDMTERFIGRVTARRKKGEDPHGAVVEAIDDVMEQAVGVRALKAIRVLRAVKRQKQLEATRRFRNQNQDTAEPRFRNHNPVSPAREAPTSPDGADPELERIAKLKREVCG